MSPREQTEQPRDVILTANMTLRDYFAAQTLANAFNGGDTEIHDEVFARRAYELADAMLRARDDA
jgi:hypothetical protein